MNQPLGKEAFLLIKSFSNKIVFQHVFIIRKDILIYREEIKFYGNNGGQKKPKEKALITTLVADRRTQVHNFAN